MQARKINVITEPEVHLLSDQNFYVPDKYAHWTTDAPSDAEELVEFSGRMCYVSFGAGDIDGHKAINGRVGNAPYIDNIISVKHGSVIEHAVFSLLFEGVSRSLTHELIRHRSGMSYSQLSQRYVDESAVSFVLPPEINEGTPAYRVWEIGCTFSLDNYRDLLEVMKDQLEPENDRPTMKVKRARQVARAVLPNCAETKIVCTGNTRAWRHFVEMRGSTSADIEMRYLAAAVVKQMKESAPNIFADIEVCMAADGHPEVTVGYSKV
jgi:thymidylate synthase (FAD)